MTTEKQDYTFERDIPCRTWIIYSPDFDVAYTGGHNRKTGVKEITLPDRMLHKLIKSMGYVKK